MNRWCWVTTLVAVLGCSPSGAAGHKGGPMEVVLLVFSGRENPSVALSPAQARGITDAVRQLPRGEATAPPDGLGYLGFIIQPSAPTDSATRIHVYRGIVWEGDATRLDAGRALERRLFELIGPALEPSVRAVVEADLRR